MAGKLKVEWTTAAEEQRYAWLAIPDRGRIDTGQRKSEGGTVDGGMQLLAAVEMLQVLQQQLIQSPGPLTRSAFIKEVRENRCSLHFPSVTGAGGSSGDGDFGGTWAPGSAAYDRRSYVVLRTPLMAHLVKHTRLSRVCDVSDLQVMKVSPTLMMVHEKKVCLLP